MVLYYIAYKLHKTKKTIVLLFFLIFGLSSFSQSKNPELQKKGKELKDLIPEQWKLLATTNGDLNYDGINDVAFVIENTDKKNIKLNGTDFGRDSINLNPRILGIYFGKRNGKLVKKLQSDTFILLQDSPTMDEPFDGIEIFENGVLQIEFKFWFSAGSWSMSNHIYQFKFQNKAFELIDYKSGERHRGTGEEIDYSINFLTQKMRIIVTSFDDETEERVYEETLKEFELEKLKSIQSLKKLFEWEFLEIRI